MKMTAQYTPYRDMVSVENDNDHNSEWDTGNDRGYVQIYEKTVEDRQVVPQRNLVVGGIALALFCSMLGLLIGYFAHSNHSECIPNLSISLHAVRDEDVHVRAKLLSLIDASQIKEYTRKFSLNPHPAGSEIDEKMADEIHDLWHAYGLDKVEKKSYKVLLPELSSGSNPKLKIVDENGNTGFEMNSDLNLKESNEKKQQFFSPYSPSGFVTGGLVYVNRASEADLRFLQDEMKINLSQKIVMARQLDISPIQQVQNLRKYNVSGLILYPDGGDYFPPRVHAKPYPYSLWLPDDGVIQDAVWWEGLGDPETIGYPSTDNAYRLPQDRDKLLPPFPVQPISFHEATQYLRLLAGEKAPESWWSQGGNLSFHLGPNFTNPSWKFQMSLQNSYLQKNIYNILGYIKGKIEPDRYILVGSQRDSLSFGAVDSAAGSAVLMELVRVFGLLLKEGWRPRRTIIFCSWGAEEYGWIGSTEWMEENFKMLREQAVAYINADDLVFENVSITATASPLLFHAIFNATKSVSNPYELDLSGSDHDEDYSDSNTQSVYDAWLITFPDIRNKSTLLFPDFSVDGAHGFDDEFIISVADLPMDEHTHKKKKLFEVYMHAAMLKKRPKINVSPKKNRNVRYMRQIGVPTVDIAYVNDYQVTKVLYPLYHSQYDTFEAIINFVDPKFKVHAAVTKVLAELLRDIADSLFIPFNLIDYAQHFRDLSIAVQTNLTLLAKKEKIDLDISVLESAINGFTEAAVNFHKNQEELDLSDPMTIRRTNDQLLILERIFLDPINIRQEVPTHHSNLATDVPISDSLLQDLLYFSATSNGWGMLADEHLSEHSEAVKLIEKVYFHLVFACQSATKVLEGLV